MPRSITSAASTFFVKNGFELESKRTTSAIDDAWLLTPKAQAEMERARPQRCLHCVHFLGTCLLLRARCYHDSKKESTP